jgi:hypothetical protein
VYLCGGCCEAGGTGAGPGFVGSVRLSRWFFLKEDGVNAGGVPLLEAAGARR